MEGGNGASNGRGITHSPLGEQTAARHAYQIDEAENLPRMDSALGVHLDGVAVKEKRKPPKVLRTWKTASPRWFADVSSAPVGGGANPRCREFANNRSRWTLAFSLLKNLAAKKKRLQLDL